MHAVNPSQLSVRQAAFADIANVIIAQFGKAVPLAAHDLGRVFSLWVVVATKGVWTVAAFLHHVFGVVGLGAKEKVRWVNAGWRVALVQNAQAGRYGACVHFVRNAVRQLLSGKSTGSEKSIPFVVFVGVPKPATFGRFAKLLVKSNFRRRCHLSIMGHQVSQGNGRV
jgi:hypothetical protein